MLFYITTTQIKTRELDSENVWGLIIVVVLSWGFKTGVWYVRVEWNVRWHLCTQHASALRIVCQVKDWWEQGCMLQFETVYSTWVPDQDETPHFFIENRAMDLYCRGCRQFCLYIFCWKAHNYRKVKIYLLFWLVPKFQMYFCPSRLKIHFS
jgi:hypothetical protein